MAFDLITRQATELFHDIRQFVRKGFTEDFLAAVDLSDEPGGIGAAQDIRDPYLQSSWVKACVDAISNDVAGIPFIVRDRTSLIEIKRGPVVALLRRPNSSMSGFQLIRATQHYLDSKGEAFWILDDAVLGVPGNIWVFNPARFQEVVSPSTGMLQGWLYTAPGHAPQGFTVEEVIHFKMFNPVNDVRGLSTLGGARLAVQQDYWAQKYNEAFFKNSAEPSGFISTDKPLGDAQRKRIEEAWRSRYQGPGRAKKVALLEGGMKWNPATFNPHDMEFVNLRKLSREEIAAVFGVPPGRIGILEHVNYATSKEERRIYWESTVVPRSNYLQAEVNYGIFDRFLQNAEFFFDLSKVSALKETLKDKVLCAKDLVLMGFTLNNVNERLDLGMKPEPHGDVYLVPITLVPASMLVNGESLNDPITPTPDTTPVPENDVAPPKESVHPALRKSIFPTGRTRFIHWKSFVQTLLPIEVRYRNILRDFYRTQKRAVLTNVVRVNRTTVGVMKGSNEELAESILFNITDAARKLQLISRPFFEKAMQKGADSLRLQIGLDPFNLTDQRAEDALKRRDLAIRRPLETSRESLRTSLLQGLRAGDNVRALSERVTAHYDTQYSHATTVARTEILSPANEARLITVEDSGAEEGEWVTAGDEAVRNSHAAENGNHVPTGENFPETGVSFPGDPTGDASEVINCRCTLVPFFVRS